MFPVGFNRLKLLAVGFNPRRARRLIENVQDASYTVKQKTEGEVRLMLKRFWQESVGDGLSVSEEMI
ncbi:MAG: hypothetical protein EBE86_016040 [Hormoscilla sp. GUM202]|nr:hypothetical protein [Hormoscilla sp. GUM202]